VSQSFPAGTRMSAHPLRASCARLTGQKLGYLRGDGDGRLSQDEQLVDDSTDTAEDDANEPRSEREARHVRVVGDFDDGSNLCVRRVLGYEQRLELHLVDNLLMLVRALQDRVLVAQELVDTFEDGLGEVLVVLMEIQDLLDDLGVSALPAIGESPGLTLTVRSRVIESRCSSALRRSLPVTPRSCFTCTSSVMSVEPLT